MLKTSAESSDTKQNGGSSVGGRLKQKIDREYRYSREEMLRISKCDLSLQRPSYLSTEFDNENGKFQPDKWLEYRWVVEGIENRPNANARRKEKIKPEVLDGNCTVLSPQRRGFSSGCRATSPHKNECESERLGANKGSWRSGAGFMLKNSTSTNDFKPSFQKNNASSGDNTYARRQGNNADRRAAGDGSFKPSFHKDAQSQGRNRLISSLSGEEKVPEWMEEGPTSMLDMIELKGFDDERKNTKRASGNKAKKEATSKQHAQQKTGAGKSSVANRLEASMTQSSGDRVETAVTIVDSKSSSRESSCASPNVDKAEKNQTVSSSEAVNNLPSKVDVSSAGKTIESPVLPASLLNNKLPNSDAEFAAIMGLLDTNDFDPLKEDVLSTGNVVSSDPAPCSRLSRFFSTTNKTEISLNQQIVPPGDSNNNESSASIQNDTAASSTSILRKIFASSQSSSPMHLEPSVPGSLPGVVRAEDLEKGFQWEAARGVVAPPSTSNGNDHVRQYVVSPHSSTTSRHNHLASYLVSKGNPLGDPRQQEQLMSKLNKFALQQDLSSVEELAARSNSVPGPLLSQHVGISAGQLGGNISEIPRFRAAPQNIALQAAFIRSQMDEAFLKNLQLANQQRAAAMMQSPQPADVNAVRAILTNLMTSNNASHATAGGGLNIPATTSATQPRNTTAAVPNAFMPTSVMRQMTKNNVSVEDKNRRAGSSASGSNHTDDDTHRSIADDTIQKQLDYMRNNATNLNGNNPDAVSKLLQQQYIRAMAAMRSGIHPGSWPLPPQLFPQWRAQAFAASQAEQQRLYTLALMRNDVEQAQAIRARMLSQQAAVASLLNASAPATSSVPYPHNPQTVVAGQSTAYTSGPVPQLPDASTQNVHKYQSPLEKLLQSAGVPTKQPGRSGFQEKPQGNHGIPSIISRLPPQANCISVEDLEKQYASN